MQLHYSTGKKMTLTYVHQDTYSMQENILRLADNMAAAATGFNSHGYDLFINAREEFKEYVNNNFQKLDCKDYFTIE
jgi:hypothetical protein